MDPSRATYVLLALIASGACASAGGRGSAAGGSGPGGVATAGATGSGGTASGGTGGRTEHGGASGGGGQAGHAGSDGATTGAAGRADSGAAGGQAGAGAAGSGGAPGTPWVGTWAAAQVKVTSDALPPSPGLAGNTLRQVVHVSLGGKQVRIRLDNSFGDGPVSISAAHVAISKGADSIDTATDRPLTFAGSPVATVQAGAVAYSDPTDFALPAVTSLAVTIVFDKVPRTLTGHVNSKSTSFLHSGNMVSAASLPSAAGTLHWYYLSGVDVIADGATGSVVCIGDSTTEGDGFGDPDDVDQRWPDDFARRLHADSRTRGVGVLNEGIGSNTVLPGSWSGSVGLPLVQRFSTDVLSQVGVRWVVILEGVNDIGNCPAGKAHDLALDIISNLQSLIAMGHARGIRVYGATIMPFGAASGYGQTNGQLVQDHIDAWKTVNDWIRTSGAYDGVIDFAAAIADPQRPDHVLSKYVTFDGLHPSTAGYQQMADSIDLTLFAN